MSHDKVIHIIPINDERMHCDGTIFPPFPDGNYCPCKCHAIEEIVNNVLIVTHNSFDGREGVEWTNEILNQ